MGRAPDYKAAFLATMGANPAAYAPFDENAWVPHSGANQRPVSSLVAEFAAVRGATLAVVGFGAIGTLLVVSDDRGVLRAVDWDDHLPRFHRLLQRHYGRAGHVLDERPAGSAASSASNLPSMSTKAIRAGAVERLAQA